MPFVNLNTIGLQRFESDIVSLWIEAYSSEKNDPDPSSPEELRGLFPTLIKQSQFPNFLAVAYINDQGQLIGLTTGWPLNEALRIRFAMTLGENSEWLKDVFYLSGLAVLPSEQGRGIARDLLGSIYSQTTCTRTVLTTYLTQTRAVDIYEKTGWQNVSMKYQAPNKKFYRIMGKSLK